jgi:hypothetical protein
MDTPTKSEIHDGTDSIAARHPDSDTEVIDPVAQKRLLLKLDLYIAPVMTLIFLTAYLDRSNIGNAASAGMTKDLKMTSAELGSEFPQIALPNLCLTEVF